MILSKIQTELKVPKGQFNNFGKYKYRSLEDILEGLKPILKEYECGIVLSDEIELIGNRYYIKATAKLMDKEKLILKKGWMYLKSQVRHQAMHENML